MNEKNLQKAITESKIESYLILFVCEDCGEEHYFSINSLPGGDEHCEYCEFCSGRLVKE